MNGIFFSIGHLFYPCLTIFIVESVSLFFPFFQKIQWWLCKIYISLFYQFLHIPENKSENQSSDMTSVHVGIRHDNQFMIAKFTEVKRLGILRSTNLYTQGSKHIPDFLIIIYFMFHRLFYIQNFTT